MNPNAKKGIANFWKNCPKDKNGKRIIKRKSIEERIKIKKEKLAALMVKVEKLQAEITKLDNTMNRSKKLELMNRFTLSELEQMISK